MIKQHRTGQERRGLRWCRLRGASQSPVRLLPAVSNSREKPCIPKVEHSTNKHVWDALLCFALVSISTRWRLPCTLSQREHRPAPPPSVSTDPNDGHTHQVKENWVKTHLRVFFFSSRERFPLLGHVLLHFGRVLFPSLHPGPLGLELVSLGHGRARSRLYGAGSNRLWLQYLQ